MSHLIPLLISAPIFDHIDLWIDQEARNAAENMAIDELLLENIDDRPLLRVYGWSEPTISFGYFLKHELAKKAYTAEGLRLMRRMTGGGIVDHREDLTYTLVVPMSCPLANLKGGESYKMIHQTIANALLSLGEKAAFCSDAMIDTCGGDDCFSNPVPFDLVDENGRKIAGAGQRRTRDGLLHQGSIKTRFKMEGFAQEVSSQMAKEISPYSLNEGFLTKAHRLAEAKYSTDGWKMKK